MDREKREGLHERKISDLICEFSSEDPKRVREIYKNERERLEQVATIPNFIPVMAYRKTQLILRKQQDKRYIG